MNDDQLLPATRGIDSLSERSSLTKHRQSLKADQTLTEMNFPNSPQNGFEDNYIDLNPMNRIQLKYAKSPDTLIR